MTMRFPASHYELPFKKLPHHYRAEDFFPVENLLCFIASTDHPVAVSPHDHNFYELMFVVHGYGVHHRKSGETLEMINFYPGDVFVVRPGEVHWYTDCQKLWLFNVLLRPELLKDEHDLFREMELLRQLFECSPDEPSKKLHVPPEFFFSAVENLNWLLKEQASRAPGFRTALRNGVVDFLILLGRLPLTSPEAAGKKHAEYHNLISMITAYMGLNLKEKFSLDELARRACMSKAHFCRRFKEETGASPWTYLTLLRLEKAKKLLECSELSPGEIAGLCGFYDASYFSRQFRRYVKVTPLEYREKHSNKKIRLFLRRSMTD